MQLESWPLESWQVIAGAPGVFGKILDAGQDGGGERGVWEHSAGSSRDVETDEFFVVLFGRATVEIEGGPILELKAGDAAELRGGDRTVWHVHEPLRKLYMTASARPG